MKTRVMIGKSKNGWCLEGWLSKDNNINFTSFKIGKNIGEEKGWITAGNDEKILERYKFLIANKNNYKSNNTYNDKVVTQRLSDYVNQREDKLKALRKVMEISLGYNCVGSSRVSVSMGEKETNLKEWVENIFNRQ